MVVPEERDKAISNMTTIMKGLDLGLTEYSALRKTAQPLRPCFGRLSKAKADKIDLVITEQTMPGMAGERFARELLKIIPDIPVILCSGFSKVMDEIRAKSAGIRAYVMKPLAMGDLVKTVRKVLDEKHIEND